jgi:hypothetical protein
MDTIAAIRFYVDKIVSDQTIGGMYLPQLCLLVGPTVLTVECVSVQA